MKFAGLSDESYVLVNDYWVETIGSLTAKRGKISGKITNIVTYVLAHSVWFKKGVDTLDTEYTNFKEMNGSLEISLDYALVVSLLSVDEANSSVDLVNLIDNTRPSKVKTYFDAVCTSVQGVKVQLTRHIGPHKIEHTTAVLFQSMRLILEDNVMPQVVFVLNSDLVEKICVGAGKGYGKMKIIPVLCLTGRTKRVYEFLCRNDGVISSQSWKVNGSEIPYKYHSREEVLQKCGFAGMENERMAMKVLADSLAEINEKLHTNYSLEKVRDGRKVIGLKFIKGE